MTAAKPPVVRVTRRYPYPAERIFDAWLNPAFTSKWLFATPGGEMVRAEADPRVGGRFTFTEKREGEDFEHTGEYLEIERPRRLVFTFGLPKFSDNFDRVTVEITPSGDGCELALTHEYNPKWAEFADRTRDGWATIIENLAANLGEDRAATNMRFGEVTAPDELCIERILPGPIERAWDYIMDGEKRAKWLAGGTIEPRVGGRVSLFFRHNNIAPQETPPEKYKKYHDTGDTMEAQVTQYDPPRLLAFTWEGDTPEQISEVTFELAPHGSDTRLVLTHRRLSGRDQMLGVSAGWHTHLSVLIADLSGNTDPRAFWARFQRLRGIYEKRIPA